MTGTSTNCLKEQHNLCGYSRCDCHCHCELDMTTTTNQPGAPERVWLNPRHADLYAQPEDRRDRCDTIEYVRADLVVRPAEVDVRAAAQQIWECVNSALAKTVPPEFQEVFGEDAGVQLGEGAIAKIAGIIATYMGQPATERARQAAEEIVTRSLVYYADLDGPRELKTSKDAPRTTAEVTEIIVKHLSASRGDGEQRWQPIETCPFATHVLLLWKGGTPKPHYEIVIGVIPVTPEFTREQWWNGQRGEYESMTHIVGWQPLPAITALEEMERGGASSV